MVMGWDCGETEDVGVGEEKERTGGTTRMRGRERPLWCWSRLAKVSRREAMVCPELRLLRWYRYCIGITAGPAFPLSPLLFLVSYAWYFCIYGVHCS